MATKHESGTEIASGMRPNANLKRRLAPALAITVAVSVILGGCAAGAEKSDSIRYVTALPEDPAVIDLIEADIANFEEQSGVDVELDLLSSDAIRTQIQTQLQSGDGPDVFVYNPGPGFAGALFEAGLIYPLTDAYAEHEWPIFPFAIERITTNDEIIGIPREVETIGLFYNQTLFDDLGLEVPVTLSDLFESCEVLLDNGIIPLSASDLEGWQGLQYLSLLLAGSIGSQGIRDLASGDLAWDSPEAIRALSTLADLNESGCFTPDVAAVNYDNSNALFYSGESAMHPTGTWLVSDIEANADFEVGFVPFPGQDAPGIFVGGLGSGLFVSAATKNPEGAIALLDYMVSPEHGKWEVENFQTIPAFPLDTSTIDASPLFSTVLNEAAKLAEGSGDFADSVEALSSPEFIDVIQSAIQGLLSGQFTPEEAAQQLQAAAAA